MTREHSSICEYWLDQYWNECSCGLNKEMSQLEYFEMKAKEIDAGAKALRQHEQGGRLLRPWESLPDSDKKKWRIKAQLVLNAAISARGTSTSR